MKIRYRCRMIVALSLVCIIMIFAYAGITNAEEGKKAQAIVISGDMNSNNSEDMNRMKMIDNYYLDMKSADILAVGANIQQGLSNTLFSSFKNMVLATSVIFYNALNLNIGDMFGTEINAMQSTLRQSVFLPLFYIGFAGSVIIILKRMIHKDFMGSYGQIAKVIMLFLISILLVSNSSTVITKATQITSNIGASILSGGESSSGSYALKVSAQIWKNMLHTPWEYLEFGNDDHTEDDVKKLLSLPLGQDRTDYINTWQGTAFDTNRPVERTGFLFLYAIPVYAKCILYIIMGGILLLMQLMAIFYVLIAPFVLILAMMPGFDNIVTAWIKKLIESQLSSLVVYFIIGLLLRVDEMLYNNMASQWGWFVVLVIQTVLYIGIIIKRNELFSLFSSLGISNPIKYMNGEVSLLNNAKNAAVQKTRYALSEVYKKGGSISDSSDSSGKQTHQETSAKLRKVNVSKEETTPYEPKKEIERPRMAAFREREAIFTYEPGESPGRGENEPQRPMQATFRERQVIFQYSDTNDNNVNRAYESNQPTQRKVIERPRMDAMDQEDREVIFYGGVENR